MVLNYVIEYFELFDEKHNVSPSSRRLPEDYCVIAIFEEKSFVVQRDTPKPN